MNWEQLPEVVDDWAVKIAALAWDVKQAVADVLTVGEVGYHYDPVRSLLAIHGRGATPADLALCKSAAARVVGTAHIHPVSLTNRDFTGDHCWVKVAYSHAVRRAGELLNFFPGTYAAGIPNAPSPLASMLTAGLVGGGLGYGTGWLAEKVLPKGWGGRLKRTGGVLGALIGAAPGAAWLASNLTTGHGPLDPYPLNQPPSDNLTDAVPEAASSVGTDTTPMSNATRRAEAWLNKRGAMYDAAVDSFVKRAFDDSFGGFADPVGSTPYDVNINALGQTLWQAGANPPTAGAVMGTMYTAQQLPDPRSSPGWVTVGQLGQLAANAGKDYLTGALVGAAINTVVGTPFKASTYGGANVALGVVKSVLSKLFS